MTDEQSTRPAWPWFASFTMASAKAARMASWSPDSTPVSKCDGHATSLLTCEGTPDGGGTWVPCERGVGGEAHDVLGRRLHLGGTPAFARVASALQQCLVNYHLFKHPRHRTSAESPRTSE